MSSAKKKWPMGPLQRAIDTACIVEQVPTIHSLASSRGYNTRDAEKAAETYRTGVREGLVTLRTVDQFCIDLLGVHPIEVYGDDYFNPEYDCLSVGKPCRSCGGPKEEGRLHLCEACSTRDCACGCGQPTRQDRKYVAGHNPYGRKSKAA